jgi:site-specific DNA-methyltransferase (adenine-specific)
VAAVSERVQVIHGDSREVLKTLADNSVDSCCTDPPYALVSIGKRFGADNAAPCKEGKSGVYKRASAGFMGQKWDTGETAFDPDFWREVFRVLKPGAHLLAFSGTRTYHRMTCAIEDAGFEIRDMVLWHYASGFPKSHNMIGEWEGWGTALKPASEPIVLARKPLSEKTVAANVLRWGTGALNIDACRIDGYATPVFERRSLENEHFFGVSGNGSKRTGVMTNKGRWPANLCHDGSEEVLLAFPESEGQQGEVRGTEPSECHSGVYSGPRDRQPFDARNDSGSAARFFFSAKADSDDRMGSKHPTVKPVDLMRWLVRLVTPPNGLTLDPFAGSGTTGIAAIAEQKRAILIEREAEYVEDIHRRLAHVSGKGPLSDSVKLRNKQIADAGPLFGEIK